MIERTSTLYEKYGEASFICNTHEIYYDKETQNTNVILYHRGHGLEVNLGLIGPSGDSTSRKIYCSNECICFYDVGEKGKTTIKYLFYIPSLTFINGDEEQLEEMFMLIFGTPFNADRIPKKQMVRHITLTKTSTEN